MPALIFDCDGVLADTEQYGHLPAFNQTFADFDVPVQWSVSDYAQKVKIGGGKERMRSMLTPSLRDELGLNDDAAILSWHKRKTEVYKELVESGVMPARPGIARIMSEARDAGWTLAVASVKSLLAAPTATTYGETELRPIVFGLPELEAAKMVTVPASYASLVAMLTGFSGL